MFATLVTSPHLYTYDLTVLLLPAWLVGCTLLPHFSHVSAAGRWLLALTVGLLFGAGVSVQLAELMPIQLTVVAMLACVWILGARSLYRSAPVADAARPPAAAH